MIKNKTIRKINKNKPALYFVLILKNHITPLWS